MQAVCPRPRGNGGDPRRRGDAGTHGARLPRNPPLSVWQESHPRVGLKTAADAAAEAELIVNATNGAGSIAMLELAGEENLSGKVLIDIANPLDFSQERPPSLFVSNTDSLGEQIQRRFPQARSSRL
jgi:8-hydroxy-5-deazaflavin:NADPH oxidoreductase